MTKTKKSKNGRSKNKKATAKVKQACLIVEYLGFDEGLDAQVKQLVKLPLAASGFAFLDGVRDLSFEGSEPQVEQAEAVIQSVLLSNDPNLFLPEGKAYIA